ncbi:MAG: methanogen output domain 1-containing protein [Thalassovita sp.]|nr:methanogen output domain 1-containing protein [Thalassovita sp.]
MDRESFLSNTLYHLTQTLETVAGVEEAEAFFSTVGSELGQDIWRGPKPQPEGENVPSHALTDMLLEIETGIGGAFKVISHDEKRIVLENSTCPFGMMEKGTGSVCMVTANLLGHLASKSAGYAKVHLEKTIARGDGYCRMTLTLVDDNSPGFEYFADD